jgi:hypothetical protein
VSCAVGERQQDVQHDRRERDLAVWVARWHVSTISVTDVVDKGDVTKRLRSALGKLDLTLPSREASVH